ncbi:hypothetical protein EJ077_16675 [Mesorhizobium sp. M8A.F.Ca.ET.057.01.1.1]|uniref:hypothetical protein n=1 Tax=Mesorhizobium sp. M8A.F.Ca.ET.057.01.1.1 TaxID=2493679 RepID=UPI000F75E6A8|nr:hypothetical protein [Mesorhizobium sp. M8A.F.Ca.ET.057.01.1.1]AZO54898.1 hypothetical protein EJ077_16675 [Mesorhizobium sp. M8A.F.Ca.ET.057.01.1.1]
MTQFYDGQASMSPMAGAEIVSDNGKNGIISMPPIDGPALVTAELPNIMKRITTPEGLVLSLPRPAAMRYRKLTELKEDAHTLYLAAEPKIEEIRVDISKARTRLARFDNEWRLTMSQDELEAGKAEMEKAIARLKADIAYIEERRQPYSMQLTAIGTAIRRADAYIARIGPYALKDAALPKLGKGETVDAAVARIAALRAELADVISRPWPAADAKARARREVEFLADEGRVDVSKSVLHRNQLGWPVAERTINLRGFGKGIADQYDTTNAASTLAVVCWLFKDDIIAKLNAEIDAAAHDTETQAMTAEQRTAQVAKIKNSIEAEQRIMAAIIWQDEAFDRIPGDMDPRALLGLTGPEPGEFH